MSPEPLAEAPPSADAKPVERRQPWFKLLGASIAWGAHFMGGYLLSEAACQAGDFGALLASDWGGFVLAEVALTIVCVAVALAAGLVAHRQWLDVRRSGQDQAAEGPGFVGLEGVALSALFGALIVTEGLSAVVLDPCF
jgi:hypothetical protein